MKVKTLNLMETKNNVNAKLPTSNKIKIVNFAQSNSISAQNAIQLHANNVMTDFHTMKKRNNAIAPMIRISIKTQEDVRIRQD